MLPGPAIAQPSPAAPDQYGLHLNASCGLKYGYWLLNPDPTALQGVR